MGRAIDVIPTETLDALRRQPWPGNVRELENVIQRAVILSTGSRLSVPTAPPALTPSRVSTDERPDSLRSVERAHVLRVLEETNWIVGGPHGAAARLGLRSRGRIEDGFRADLVVFDPATVRSHATYDEPRRFPTGIELVVVNGVVVVDRERHTGATPGRGIRLGRD